MALSYAFESAVGAPQQTKQQVELTERQLTVLGLICEGVTTKDLAARLNISVKTAEFHRGRLLTVFDVKNTVQLVRTAIRHGLIAP
jgi:DNA-binding CsgD family transcriptional regulator